MIGADLRSQDTEPSRLRGQSRRADLNVDAGHGAQTG